MSAPLMPSPLDYVGRRRFSFYPPIRNAEPNEWLLGAISWSEVQVVNAHTGQKLWVPWQWIGGVAEGSDLTLTVGLTKELELSGGVLSPRIKRIIEMPARRDEAKRKLKRKARRQPGLAPVVGIRVEAVEDSQVSKILNILGVAFIVILASIILLASFSHR